MLNSWHLNGPVELLTHPALSSILPRECMSRFQVIFLPEFQYMKQECFVIGVESDF